MDETPLPNPMPYHLADRTSQPDRISSGDLDDVTRVDDSPSGLAHAARRISGLISDSRGIPHEVDLSAELDTRQRRRIEAAELNKIAKPPPTIPIQRIDDLDELETPPPPDFDLDDGFPTDRQRGLSPQPRGSDDALTPARTSSRDIVHPPRTSSRDIIQPPRTSSRDSLPRVGMGRTPSRPSGVISIPPKTPSRPPGVIAIPPKPPSRPPGALTPPGGSPLARVRPGPPGPPPRPAMPKIPRDSESELTKPRDRGAPNRDDDDD
jgi:hypothetical protein